MWFVQWRREGESSLGAEGARGGGGREFPAGYDVAEVVAPIAAPNICLQKCF